MLINSTFFQTQRYITKLYKFSYVIGVLKNSVGMMFAYYLPELI